MDKVIHKKQTISGLKWSLLNQLVAQGITLGVSIALMRLLGPEEFGLLGMITVFSGFLIVFRDFGLGSALIQKAEIDDLDKSTIFWVNVALGLILSIALILASPLLAEFYHEPLLIELARILAAVFSLQALGDVQQALLRKALLFKKLFWVNTSAACVAGIVALTAAFMDAGVWALVFQQVILAAITLAILWVVSPWRPKFMFSKARLKKHLKFGAPLAGTQTVHYWTRNADNLLIGKFFGAGDLGIYTRAYSIMMLPVSQVSRIIASVMFPSLSLIKDDKKRVKAIYLKISRMISFITFPLMGSLIVAAEPFVNFILGHEWRAMIPVLQILSVVGALQSIGTLNGNIFLSQGKTNLQFRMNVITGLFIVSAFATGILVGRLSAVAWSYLTAVLIIMPVQWYIMGKLIHCQLKEIIANILPNILICTFLIVSGMLLIKRFETMADYLKLILTVFYFSFGWLILTWSFNNRQFREIKQLKKDI